MKKATYETLFFRSAEEIKKYCDEEEITTEVTIFNNKYIFTFVGTETEIKNLQRFICKDCFVAA